MAAVGEFGLLAKLSGVNLNVANTDNEVKGLPGRYFVTGVIMTNFRLTQDPQGATTTLGAGASTVTSGLFTAVSAGGTAVVATSTVAAATSNLVRISRTVAAGGVFETNPIYFRTVVAQGATAYCDVLILGEEYL